jgi:CheY-like chemotaxis protein
LARILIIDDEESIRRSVAKSLEGLGHAVFMAESAAEGLRLAQ